MGKINKSLDTLKAKSDATSKSTAATAKGVGALVAMEVLEFTGKAIKALYELAMAAVAPIVSANKFARSIGDSIGPVLELRSALEQLGGSADTVDSALVQIGKAVAKAQYDTTTEDIFKRLGLKVKDLEKLKPHEMFIKVAEAISKIPDPLKRAAIATQLFGDNAVELLPLLAQGAEGIAQLMDQASKMGQTATDAQAAAVEALDQKWKNVLSSIDGVGKQLALQIAPIILALIEDVGGFEMSVINIKAAVEAFAITIARVVIFAQDAFDMMKIAGDGVAIAVLKTVQAILWALQKTAELAAKLDPSGFSDAMAKAIENFKEGVKGMAADAIAEAEGFAKAIKDRDPEAFLAKAKKIAEAQDKINKKAKDAAAQPFAKFNKDLFEGKGLAAIEENLSPLERFNTRMAELDKLLESGAITWDTYGRASAKALNDLEAAMGDKEIKFAGVAKAGTHEAYTAIIRNEAMAVRNRETPEKRMERLAKEALELARKQLGFTEKIAEAAANRKVVKI